MKAYFLILSFLVISVASFAQQSKQLQFKEELYDFGRVPEDNGPVTHEFLFTNNSNRPVRIITVQASCGCTTPGWTKEAVDPGKTGYIQASFNPKGRPGYFNKSLTVTSDLDPNPIILQIKGQVETGGEKGYEKDFLISNGSLKLKSSSFNMGKVYLKDEFVTREFPIVNAGEKPLTFTGKIVTPKYIKVDVQPLTLAPGAKGTIKVNYNGKIKNQYGFQSDNVELQTNDETNPVKSFSVFATLEEYFPEMSTDELAKAPQLRLNAYSMDFGRVKSNGRIEREIQFTNVGKKELNLRSLQPNCTCVTASANKSVVKPGESSTIKISLEPQDRSGTMQKAVTIYSNDPKNPVQRFTFTAYVD